MGLELTPNRHHFENFASIAVHLAGTEIACIEPSPPPNTGRPQKPVCNLAAITVTAGEAVAHRLAHRVCNSNFKVGRSKLVQRC